jgi:hypothetical protein
MPDPPIKLAGEARKPLGDPTGRRLAKHRAILLAEAARIARSLEVLLKRANYDFSPCAALIKKISEQEHNELQRGFGRIESRKKYKTGSSHPLLEGRPRSIIFIDESGKSDPQPLAEAPPFFALAAIALPEEKIDDYVVAANEVKQEFFKRSDITFHEPQMRHREGWFYLGGDQCRQDELDQAVNKLLTETPFVAFGVGVRKEGFAKEFVDSGIDPYLSTDVYAVAILMLLERYIDFLAAQSKRRFGRVIFESQGTVEDATHQLEYARILLDGSQWVPDSAFRAWLEPGLRFQPKCGSDPMEIADMFARDLYEWIRGECKLPSKRWELFSEKIYCRENGLMGKFGVKIFPDADIRERIEAHRLSCGATLKP